jgi:hypothetical protein
LALPRLRHYIIERRTIAFDADVLEEPFERPNGRAGSLPLAEVAMQAVRVAGNRALAARLDLSLCGRASRTGAFAALGLATG